MDSENYVGMLLSQLPEFEEYYQEHLTQYETRIDHLLFDELFQFTAEAYEQRNLELVERVIVFINQAAKSQDEVLVEMVQHSFIEYLADYQEMYHFIKPLLNPHAH